MSVEEKRRELFEPWVIEEADRRNYAHPDCVLKRDPIGGYATTWVDMAWLGFSAALDAVEIELPEVVIFLTILGKATLLVLWILKNPSNPPALVSR